MTTTQQTIRAHELRDGDKLSIDGNIRTVTSVHVGTSETHVVLTGNAFPASFILWNGDDVRLV